MKSLPISQVDTLFAGGQYPIEMMLFYAKGIPTGRVQAALRSISPAFWPAFGAYGDGRIRFEDYDETLCFNELWFDESFDPSQSDRELFETFRNIGPAVMARLFHLTVIQCPNGTILVPRMSHLAGDGYSYLYLLSALAAIAKSGANPLKRGMIRTLLKPVHDRTGIRSFQFRGDALGPGPPGEGLRIDIERLPKKGVLDLRKSIGDGADVSVSVNDILSAHSVKKLFSLNEKSSGETFRLTIPIDVRRHIKAFGAKFFGNALIFTSVEFSAAEIQSSSSEELSLAIRQSMPAVTGDIYIEFLKDLEKFIDAGQEDELRPYDPAHGCLVTNITRLPIDRLDFGSGLPGLIFPLTLEKNSSVLFSDKEDFVIRSTY